MSARGDDLSTLPAERRRGERRRWAGGVRAMEVEARTMVAVPAARIFEIYSDVASWSRWDPDTAEASLDGPFARGTSGRLRPARGREVPMTLAEIDRDRRFIVESRIPLFRMRFDHELTPVPGGTLVVHRVTFSGLLALVMGWLVRGPLHTGLPQTLACLKRYAETGVACR